MFRNILSLVTKPSKLSLKTLYNFAAAKNEVQVSKKQQQAGAKRDLTQYVEGQIVNRNQLTLKKQEDIEQYVLKLVRGYFRTTNKQGLNINSVLEDHGLDEFDSIELAMQVEEDLGYIISAETIPVLNKVKHFVNYINHVEQFKAENGKAPIA
ncbi:hypothetical protein ABPG72_015149 [Tetrahymena utriculariae]